MSYVIKDTKNKWWLEIDRVVQGMDIVTTIEPVYNYKVATTFDTIDEADAILKQIESEGNYDIADYTKENVEELQELEKKEKREEIIAELKKQGKSEEEIQEIMDKIQIQ